MPLKITNGPARFSLLMAMAELLEDRSKPRDLYITVKPESQDGNKTTNMPFHLRSVERSGDCQIDFTGITIAHGDLKRRKISGRYHIDLKTGTVMDMGPA